MIKKYLLIVGIIAVSIARLYSQTSINSPYSRFGIGEISRYGFNHSKAMGGLATGLRTKNQINYINPAAMSGQDTMSFIFDLGINGTFKDLESNTTTAKSKDFTFDHMAFSFPIKRWWYGGFGITPYSKIGYNIQQTEVFSGNDTVNMHYDYLGDGGINQLYISNSFKILNSLSIGFNFNYLFGSLERYNQTYLDIINSYETVVIDKISVKKVAFDFGLQYYDTFKEKYFYVVGLTYSNKIDFNSTKETAVLMTENYSNNYRINVVDYLAYYGSRFDTITSSVDNNFKIEVPSRYSIGFTAGIKNKLVVGFDYSSQDWSNIESLNINDNFGKDISYNFGIEYIPDFYTLRNYFKKINYRAGFYYNNSYIKFDNDQIKNYGITFGLGLPVHNYKTSLNISCTFGKRGTTNSGLVEENYTQVGINLTLYDFWFIKRKFQ